MWMDSVPVGGGAGVATRCQECVDSFVVANADIAGVYEAKLSLTDTTPSLS